MPADSQASLDHLTVLVTRPRDQAAELSEQLEKAGARVIHFPVIDIVPLELTPAAGDGRHIVEQLGSYEIAVFISSNAVVHADRAVRQLLGRWPRQLRLAVIGPGSEKALRNLGLQADFCPDSEYNSEGLLALPALQQVRGMRIIIFRGKGGRETLATELRRRGAYVEYAEVYQRCRPTACLEDLSQRQRDSINAIIVASNESLQNLYDMAGIQFRLWLQGVPLVVISQRSGTLAEALGFKHFIVANQATNQGIFEAVLACRAFQAPEEKDDREE